MSQVSMILTWAKHAEGVCGTQDCRNRGPLYHCLEQSNMKLPPLCAECVEKVERLVTDRRRREGIQCYRCNQTQGLRVTGLILQPGKFAYMCPACYPSAARFFDTLQQMEKEDICEMTEEQLTEWLAYEGIDLSTGQNELQSRLRQLREGKTR